ncbi:MAG: hypothetical protein DHS20C15_02970 [Planctomycetota bacterium]|nr:MAG: hypothetical protein DHS20C15_02970 [Planctomycetota bacterium]
MRELLHAFGERVELIQARETFLHAAQASADLEEAEEPEQAQPSDGKEEERVVHPPRMGAAAEGFKGRAAAHGLKAGLRADGVGRYNPPLPGPLRGSVSPRAQAA